MEILPVMRDTDRACNLTKESDEIYGNDAQIHLVITMPYVMERGKVSHVIKKRYLLCERYAAKLL
jgi:hypothetical protein